jgi:flagella basal body P-ring formation protein FlgA
MKTRLLICIGLGAAVIVSQPASARQVPPEHLCDAARKLVTEQVSHQGVTATVECPNARAIEANSGVLTWSLESTPSPLVTGPTRLVLQLSVNGVRALAVGVPVVLTLHSKAWVAQRSVEAGEPLAAGDLTLREVGWPVGVKPAVAGDAAPAGRARLALRAGDVVLASHLTPPGQKLQGDAVKVAVRSGGLTLEAPAVLTGDARVGQVARVQLRGRHDTLEGVLVDGSTVIVER